jgi:hypothetical protein
MRDLFFKETISRDKKKKTFSVLERIEENGILTQLERKSIYHIKDGRVSKILNPQPQVFINKINDRTHRKEEFSYKVLGDFYAIVSGRLYLVCYIHSFKARISATISTP